LLLEKLVSVNGGGGLRKNRVNCLRSWTVGEGSKGDSTRRPKQQSHLKVTADVGKRKSRVLKDRASAKKPILNITPRGIKMKKLEEATWEH